MEKQTRVAVTGFLVVKNKVLIVRRSSKEGFFAGFYELPGGKLNFGENPGDALRREFLEEVNLNVKVTRPYRVFSYMSGDGNKCTVDISHILELADDVSNIKLSDAHDDLKWVTIEEIDKIKMSDEMKTNIVEGFKNLKK